MNKKNYYEILEIPVDSSGDEIYRGYIKARNAYSQDSIALYSLLSKKECSEILEIIEEAYSILSNPDKREQYDAARGLNQKQKKSGGRKSKDAGSEDIGEKIVSVKGQMSKIVSQKRFSLDYEVNPEMEKKIERSNNFTGAFLKEIREYKNVDISRMADMTKVSKTYLRNIEKEDTSNLPALVYVRGFVYQYAKCLKLSPDLVASSYVRRLKELASAKEDSD